MGKETKKTDLSMFLMVACSGATDGDRPWYFTARYLHLAFLATESQARR